MDPSPVQAPPLLHDVAVKTEERVRVRSPPPKYILYTSPERTEISISLAHTGPTNHPGPTTTPARRPEVQRQVALAFCFFLPSDERASSSIPHRVVSQIPNPPRALRIRHRRAHPFLTYIPLLALIPSRDTCDVTPDAHRILARRPTRDRERAAAPSRNQVRRRFSPPTLLPIPIPHSLSLFDPRGFRLLRPRHPKKKMKLVILPRQYALRRRTRLGASNPIYVHASLRTPIDDDAHARPRSTVPPPCRPTSAPTPAPTRAGTLARAFAAARGRGQWPGGAACPHQRARVFLCRVAWPSACACARAWACPRVPGQPRAVDARTGIICAWHPKRGTYKERISAMTARMLLHYPKNQTKTRKWTADFTPFRQGGGTT